MTLAEISLGALILAIAVSCVSQMNVGVLALALAWIVGVFIGGMRVEDVIGTFPVSLFLMLTGVTLLFSQAQLNGTLDRVAHRAVRLCRGNVGLIPIMFFVLACGVASLGPGNVSTAAMLAPVAMAVAGRASIPAFLMAIMVGNGAQAGSLSPVAPTGIIVNALMTKIGLTGHELWNYWTNLSAHAAVAFAGYLMFGGIKLFRRSYARAAQPVGAAAAVSAAPVGHVASPPAETIDPVPDERLTAYGLVSAVGRVTDTTIAIARLLYSGHLTRYPDVKLVISHGGAALPMVLGRLRRSFATAPAQNKNPMEGFKKLYFDTIVYDAATLRFVCEQAGVDKVVMGTDLPFTIAEPEPVTFIDEAGFSASERDAILGGTAAKLFGVRS